MPDTEASTITATVTPSVITRQLTIKAFVKQTVTMKTLYDGRDTRKTLRDSFVSSE